jgi:hypothetical protein
MVQRGMQQVTDRLATFTKMKKMEDQKEFDKNANKIYSNYYFSPNEKKFRTLVPIPQPVANLKQSKFDHGNFEFIGGCELESPTACSKAAKVKIDGQIHTYLANTDNLGDIRLKFDKSKANNLQMRMKDKAATQGGIASISLQSIDKQSWDGSGELNKFQDLTYIIHPAFFNYRVPKEEKFAITIPVVDHKKYSETFKQCPPIYNPVPSDSNFQSTFIGARYGFPDLPGIKGSEPHERKTITCLYANLDGKVEAIRASLPSGEKTKVCGLGAPTSSFRCVGLWKDGMCDSKLPEFCQWAYIGHDAPCGTELKQI